jgi:hypothetical protein
MFESQSMMHMHQVNHPEFVLATKTIYFLGTCYMPTFYSALVDLRMTQFFRCSVMCKEFRYIDIFSIVEVY